MKYNAHTCAVVRLIFNDITEPFPSLKQIEENHSSLCTHAKCELHVGVTAGTARFIINDAQRLDF